MSVEYNKTAFGSSKGILVYPDHYVARAITLTKNHALAATVGDRKIVKAGTVYPANDATAEGVILSDVDVTFGDQTTALVIHGFIKKAAVPTAPDAAAITALKMIQFI